MEGLVLSLFPGIGMLDRGFEEEGYCIVRGPDVLWGGDIREFHPPTGVFEGVIGGPPCQAFSSLANLVRAKGLEPKWGNLIPEFSRCCTEARPMWFLMENVPKAPEPKVSGYSVTSFLLDNCWLGEAQMRKRRFSFGCRGEAPNLRRWIPGVALELPEAMPTVVAGHDFALGQRDHFKVQCVSHRQDAVPVRFGGSGKVKSTIIQKTVTQRADSGRGDVLERWREKVKTTACHGSNGQGRSERNVRDFPRRSLADMLELQGLPPDWLDHQPWTMQAKRQMVGNGVPLPMARAVARAVRRAIQSESGSP